MNISNQGVLHAGTCYVLFDKIVIEICEQATNTLHHIKRAKLHTKNSAMARFQDILRGWDQLTPEIYSSETHGNINLRMGPIL